MNIINKNMSEQREPETVSQINIPSDNLDSKNIVAESEQCIADVLQKALGLQITLTQQEKHILESMIQNSPETFTKIDAAIKEIISDGKIDMHDIPQIIVIISEIYKKHFTFKNINIINLVKFTIDSVLDAGILPFPEFEIKIAKKLIDSSLILLQTNFDKIEQVTERVCCSFFCCGRRRK